MKYDIDDLIKSFPRKINLVEENIVEHNTCDTIFKNRIISILHDVTDWTEVDFEFLDRNFGQDKSLLFYMVGWKTLYHLSPSLINASYEAYIRGDILTFAAENIFGSVYVSDDESMDFFEWAAMFTNGQAGQIQNFIGNMNVDPQGAFPDGFGQGLSVWKRR